MNNDANQIENILDKSYEIESIKTFVITKKHDMFVFDYVKCSNMYVIFEVTEKGENNNRKVWDKRFKRRGLIILNKIELKY